MSHMGWAVTSMLTASRLEKVLGGLRGPGAKVPHQPWGSQVCLFLLCPSCHILLWSQFVCFSSDYRDMSGLGAGIRSPPGYTESKIGLGVGGLWKREGMGERGACWERKGSRGEMRREPEGD